MSVEAFAEPEQNTAPSTRNAETFIKAERDRGTCRLVVASVDKVECMDFKRIAYSILDSGAKWVFSLSCTRFIVTAFAGLTHPCR